MEVLSVIKTFVEDARVRLVVERRDVKKPAGQASIATLERCRQDSSRRAAIDLLDVSPTDPSSLPNMEILSFIGSPGRSG
jgi:hypothetical protein